MTNAKLRADSGINLTRNSAALCDTKFCATPKDEPRTYLPLQSPIILNVESPLFKGYCIPRDGMLSHMLHCSDCNGEDDSSNRGRQSEIV